MSFITAISHPLGCHCGDCYECDGCKAGNCQCSCGDCQARREGYSSAMNKWYRESRKDAASRKAFFERDQEAFDAAQRPKG